MKVDSVLVLLSGGIDSTVLLHWCLAQSRRVEALFFNYGSKQNSREMDVVKQLCQKLDVKLDILELPFFKSSFKSSLLQDVQMTKSSTVVPYRNGVFLSVAAGIACSRELEAVCIANHFSDDETYPDCRAKFIKSQTETIELGTEGKVTLLSPFCHMLKEDVVREGAKLGVDFSSSYSCYRGGKLHCGTCPTCLERKKAFAAAGVLDPTEYMEKQDNEVQRI